MIRDFDLVSAMRGLALILLAMSLISCGKDKKSPDSLDSSPTTNTERQDAGNLSSAATRERVEEMVAGANFDRPDATIGLLYHLDRPIHRSKVLDWIKDAKGQLIFENKRFGYIDARIKWTAVKKLIDQSGRLGLDHSSVMKLEISRVSLVGNEGERSKIPGTTPAGSTGNTGQFKGSVHSAGYGTQLEKFREQAAKDLGITVDQLEGQGTSVAVYDSGLDLSRADVFGDRLKNFYIGGDYNYHPVSISKKDFLEATQLKKLPEHFPKEVRFAKFNESEFGDLNGSGSPSDSIYAGVYKKDQRWVSFFWLGDRFSKELQDYGWKNQILDFHTGEYYQWKRRVGSRYAGAIKIRKRQISEKESLIELALVGIAKGGFHGIANLHMIGGDYYDRVRGERYRGVAVKTHFKVAQTWSASRGGYGQDWIPLARTMIMAAEDRADVIDLDIYTPGTRNADDLLTRLSCRISTQTNSVIVAAAHNFGPLPQSVQSMAQSPCIIGVGASWTKAAMLNGRHTGGVDPNLQTPQSLMTTYYSGRGFGLNGSVKPDIIVPNYGLVPANGIGIATFGGTSGATPTLAGLIVLLKQATRLKFNRELNTHEVKLLLQAGSLAPADVRDGYGYVQMLKTWNLIKKWYTTPAKSPHRTYVGPSIRQALPHFEGHAPLGEHNVDLYAYPQKGAVDRSERFKVWIEYPGLHQGHHASLSAIESGSRSFDSAGEWLEIYDRSQSEWKSDIEMDGPIWGMKAAVTFRPKLTLSQWEGLAPGDYIALIKGVRKSLAAYSRAADFVIPVVFSKGLELKSRSPWGAYRFETPKLWADQYAPILIQTLPGESFWVSGSAQCGESTERKNFHMAVDNRSLYTHASAYNNGYSSFTEVVPDSVPTRITSFKKVTRLYPINWGSKCASFWTIRIHVHPAGFQLNARRSGRGSWEGKITMTSGGPQLGHSGTGGPAWDVKADDAAIRFSKRVREASGTVELNLPDTQPGELVVKFIPMDSDRFQGVVTAIDPATGNKITQSHSYSPNHAGLGSGPAEVDRFFFGLSMMPTKFPIELHWDQIQATDLTIQVQVSAKGVLKSRISGLSGLPGWNPGQTLDFELGINIAQSRNDLWSRAFPETEWNRDALLPIDVRRVTSGRFINIEGNEFRVWRGYLLLNLN